MDSVKRTSRWLPVIVVALYVAIPVACSIYYAVFPGGSFSLNAYSVIFEDASLLAAAQRTLMITVVTIVVLVATLVPALVAVHLWAPKLRPILEILCTLPLVVPPIAIAAGVIALLRAGAQQGRGTWQNALSQFLQNPDLPLILVGTYVVLCLPFTFRSIDAGLRTIPLKAMVEGSAILGAGLWTTIWRVVIPNIRGSMLFSIFFATALCFGEFSLAATLGQQTIPVWLYDVANSNFRSSIAIAVLLNVATWALLFFATLSADRFSPAGRQMRAEAKQTAAAQKEAKKNSSPDVSSASDEEKVVMR